MTLYTKTGDTGETSLLDGTRVPKSEGRVAAYGDVDELNATLGVALATGLDLDLSELLLEVQRDLFAIGARLADPRGRVADRDQKVELRETDVRRLEQAIDRYEAEVPQLRQFLLPGGTAGASALHLSRAVCRRAERSIVELGVKNTPVELLQYVNRLSDLLFVLARVVNHRRQTPEQVW